MEAAVRLEMPAVEARERLAAFVDEVTSVLWLPVQRRNAFLYVRGLVEQGGRKSLQPTLFRLEETPARYESMQQFLADSPWDPDLLVRECAERVVPRIGVQAWIVDDTRDPEVRPPFAGGEAAVLGHAGQDRQLPGRCIAARGRRTGHVAARLGAVPARGVVWR
jgi:hypothetical protein